MNPLQGSILFFAAVFITGGLTAQSEVIGYVVDAQGEPLYASSVAVFRNGVLIKGTESDEYGEFVLELQPSDQVELSYLGYETAKRSYAELQQDNWVVLKAGFSLETVVVYALGKRTSWTSGCWQHMAEGDSWVEERPGYATITIYPNPTADILRLSITNSVEFGQLELYSSNGVLVEVVNFSGDSADVDLSPYPSGHYYLRYLAADELMWHGKVLKMD